MSLRRIELAEDRVQGPALDPAAGPAETYKLGVFFDHWTPKVASRLFSQAMTLKSYFQRNRVGFQVAGPRDVVEGLTALGISHVGDYGDCSAYRVYISEGNEIPPEILEATSGEVESNVEYIEPRSALPSPVTDMDAESDRYGGFPLEPQGKPIAPTMVPRYFDPTRKQSEPMLAPFI